MKELGHPTELKEFIRSCGNVDCPVNPEDYTKTMKERVNDVVKVLSKKMEVGGEFNSSADAQGKDSKDELYCP